MTKALPRPTSMLNIGPAKHPAIAIAGWPALATATSATRSPTEFPHASTVRPRSAGGSLRRVPIASRQFTSSPAVVDIQNTLITNAMTTTGRCSVLGGSFSIIKWRNAREKLVMNTIDQRGKWVFGRRKTMGWLNGMNELQAYKRASGQSAIFADA